MPPGINCEDLIFGHSGPAQTVQIGFQTERIISHRRFVYCLDSRHSCFWIHGTEFFHALATFLDFPENSTTRRHQAKSPRVAWTFVEDDVCGFGGIPIASGHKVRERTADPVIVVEGMHRVESSGTDKMCE